MSSAQHSVWQKAGAIFLRDLPWAQAIRCWGRGLSSPPLGFCVLDSSFTQFIPPAGILGAHGPQRQPGDRCSRSGHISETSRIHDERRPEVPWAVGGWEGAGPRHIGHFPTAIPALAHVPRPPTAQASSVPGFVPVSPRPLFLTNKAPSPRLPPNRHLGPLGLGIKACFAKEALCLEKHPSPAAQPFKEPALFCLEKAPPD